jgi:hypothetical protein
MNNFVRVNDSTTGHPDGPMELWVKNKHVVLSRAEVTEVINAMMPYAETPPPPAEEPPPVEPPPPPAE